MVKGLRSFINGFGIALASLFGLLFILTISLGPFLIIAYALIKIFK